MHAVSRINEVNANLGFEDHELLRSFYSPNLELARREGRKVRANVASAASRKEENGGVLLLLVDAQWDFSDSGRLPVAGTFNDMERLIKRVKRGVLECNYYSGLIVTHDYHPTNVIHGDSWWEDEAGEPPDLTLPVQMELVDPDGPFPFLCHYLIGNPSRLFRPRLHSEYTVHDYAPHLKRTGQGNIWVFRAHCRIGTNGACLIPAIAELVEWMCSALDMNPIHIFKGIIPETDWFGPFGPCLDRPGWNAQAPLHALQQIRDSQRIEIAGEAEDFCVRFGLKQMRGYFGPDNVEGEEPDVLSRLALITDCTSPIVEDRPGQTLNADFREEIGGWGVKLIRHDSPIE